MSAREDLVRLALAYRDAVGSTTIGVSGRIFNDGKKLDAIIAGADITVTRWEAAMQWLADNWPNGVGRPDGLLPPIHRAPAPEPDPALARR